MPAASIEDVRFSTTEAGQPRLDGWFIPAPADAAHRDLTVLYLHDTQAGSLASTLPVLRSLHAAGANVFTFDYRGFGRSQELHPTEATANEDVDAAWDYLTGTRHLAPASIVLAGTGLGATLAANAAARHAQSAGLVLDRPAATGHELLSADPRTHWMPVRLLARDRFDPRPAFAGLLQPKLFLLPGGVPGSADSLAQAAKQPSFIHLPVTNDEAVSAEARQHAIERFLNTLTPAAATTSAVQ